MQRRELMKGLALAAGAASLGTTAGAQAVATGGRPYMLLRKYRLQQGPTFAAAANKYFSEALMPACARMGIGPIGAFSLSYGNETPTTYLLLPSTDVAALSLLDVNLVKDAAFISAAASFWGAAATLPPFERVDSTLAIAFEGYPKITPPAKEPRILQLRTYESPTYAAHIRKVEMFHQGEWDIFAAAGAKSVFYADNLVGARLPSLTYMLAHKDLAAMDQTWKNFAAHPDWKKLSTNPRYASEPIVSHVDNLVLTPMPYSQI